MDTLSHYEDHLAEFYSWIFGGATNRIRENRNFFKDHGIEPHSSRIALDLGAGSGFQSIPLAELGFSVQAIDFSEKLLKELKDNLHPDLRVDTLKADILDFDAYSGQSPELVVCMGDTLTHLKDIQSVERLFAFLNHELVNEGKIILSFRNFQSELKGAGRFIPVRSDENKIFTCFLEYSENHVTVFDIIYVKKELDWEQKISSYKKLRISRDFILQLFQKWELKVLLNIEQNGMIYIIAQKP